MDVLVTGRHCHVSDSFRDHVRERVTKIERLRDRVIRVEVQVSASPAKRQPDQGARVEITLFSKGPVVRAEGTADDKTAAFEQALERMKTQLRKAADRRKVHHGQHTPPSLRTKETLPEIPVTPEEPADSDVTTVAGIEVQGDGPLVVREKTHAAQPMSLDQALDQMELVGHDFYLFIDKATQLPSVVYRRRAYDYGVIRLDPDLTAERAAAERATGERAAEERAAS